MAMITNPQDFFTKGCGRCDRFATADCSAIMWNRGLSDLRRILLAMGLKETVKWAHPCYTYVGRNIAILTAFRGDYRLSFLNPRLLIDSEGVLERQGPNSLTPSVLRFTEAQQVNTLEPTIRSYLKHLMDHAEAGTKPLKVEREVDMPDELTDALDTDPELAEAFHALTPGRRRGYVFALNQAKKSATRLARIEKFRGGILVGKGPLDR